MRAQGSNGLLIDFMYFNSLMVLFLLIISSLNQILGSQE